MKPDHEPPRSGRLTIVLACPKCGGPIAASDEVSSLSCENCGSLLILSAPDRDEIYFAEGQVKDAAEVLELVILYRVQGYRAEIINRHQDGEGNPPSESFIERKMRAYEQELRASARVLMATCVQVPYWHITGFIGQAILGRHGDGPKIARVRAFAVEHTVPGYDTGLSNLRDRGLRLAASKVKPLTAAEVRARGPFFNFVPATDQHYREIDKWRGQDLEKGLVAVVKYGHFLFPRRLLVYRPYWLVNLMVDRGQEWVLVDGGFRTIAGYPDEVEARVLQQQGIEDPLGSGEPSYRKVNVIPSRCPDCGFEESFDARFLIVTCPNCHLALEADAQGIHLFHYGHVTPQGPGTAVTYLPFWVYDVRIEVPGGGVYEKLEDYIHAIYPQAPPPGFKPSGRQLWIPAFRLLGTEMGDSAFKDLAEALHAPPPEVLDEKVPLGGQIQFWGVSVREADARTLGPFALLGLHGKTSAARLNTMVVKKWIQDAKLTLTAPKLVLLPFSRDGEVLRLPGTSVHLAMLLLTGGPELEAHRETVHAAQAKGG